MTRAHDDKAPHEVASMFDEIAESYDRLNDVLSVGQDRLWRRAVIKAVRARPGERVLDLAAGTGTSSVPFMRSGASVVPCDFSVGMVRVGKSERPRLPFVAGDAVHLPFDEGSFDVVSISFGLRNVVDVDGALREMHRVTKPGGRLVICEFSTVTYAPLRRAYETYLDRVLTPLAGTLSRNTGAAHRQRRLAGRGVEEPVGRNRGVAPRYSLSRQNRLAASAHIGWGTKGRLTWEGWA